MSDNFLMKPAAGVVAQAVEQVAQASAEKNLASFQGEHEFETEQQIADYLSEHTESQKEEYLVRGALLRCRYGTHARRLNLPQCHGVYIGMHPMMCATDCKAGDSQNITFFGVCKAPIPPPTGIVTYMNDVPRTSTGEKCGEAPSGIVTGHKCMPVIVKEIWQGTNPKTKIVVSQPVSDVGDPPSAEDSLTNLSFLICQCGGLIEPYNSGQNYENDADELRYYEEDNSD